MYDHPTYEILSKHLYKTLLLLLLFRYINMLITIIHKCSIHYFYRYNVPYRFVLKSILSHNNNRFDFSLIPETRHRNSILVGALENAFSLVNCG